MVTRLHCVNSSQDKDKVYLFHLFQGVLRSRCGGGHFSDTFIKVIKTLKQGAYNEEGKFLPWVMRIAHNLVIDHFRRNNRMPKFENKDDFNIFSVLSDGPSMRKKQSSGPSETDVRRLIEELPGTRKRCSSCVFTRKWALRKSASKPGVSINITALGRMRYALINLRKVIDKTQYYIDQLNNKVQSLRCSITITSKQRSMANLYSEPSRAERVSKT